MLPGTDGKAERLTDQAERLSDAGRSSEVAVAYNDYTLAIFHGTITTLSMTGVIILVTIATFTITMTITIITLLFLLLLVLLPMRPPCLACKRVGCGVGSDC